MMNSPAGNCCACNWTITVRGCRSVALAGETVELKQSGVTIASDTTNASGVVVLDAPAGTYDVVVTDSAGFGYATGTTTGVVHSCNQSTTVSLSPDADHSCSAAACCPITPNAIALTFTFSGTYAGFLWPDDTLALSSSSNWLGATHFPRSGGGYFQYHLQCDSVFGYSLGTDNYDASGNLVQSIAIGSQIPGAGDCNPFDLDHGSVGANSLSDASWRIQG